MKLSARIGAIGALLTITGSAYALCNLVGTNALSVQDNSGQGNFTCDSLSTEGSTVTNLWAEGIAIVEPGSVNKTAEWMIDPSLLDTDDDGLDDRTYRVFIVSTVNGGNGSSCNYLYDGGQTLSGDKLGDPTGGQIKLYDTLVCGDPVAVVVPEEEPPEPDIVTTFGDSCKVSVTYDEDPDNPSSPLTTVSPAITDFFTYGLDANGNDLEQYGVCAGEGLGGQFECIGEDKTIPTLVPTDCPAFNEDGTIQGRCAPIDTTQRITTAAGTTIEPCWNFVNRWCGQEDDGSPECGDQLPSFDPRTLVRETASTTQVWQGSPYCYLTQKLVRGRLKDYWVCIEI